MSRKTHFDVYGELAAVGDSSPTELAGRYPFMAEDEKRIVFDIVDKLSISPSDELLDVGCGAGNIFVPLSFFVKKAVGVDHPSVVERLRQKFPGANVNLIGGLFPDIDVPGRFDKVLAYSVIHCLRDEAAVFVFVDAAMSMLRSRGKLLLGDIPNDDLKLRFQTSEFGKLFAQRWEETQRRWEMDCGKSHKPASFTNIDPSVRCTDSLVARIVLRCREQHCHAFILPQSFGLPFCHTREDILIVRP